MRSPFFVYGAESVTEAPRNPNGRTVTVPPWALWMFGVAQPVVVAFLLFVSSLMWSLNERVTVLTVQMGQALETKTEMRAIDERINLLSGRVSRLEGRTDGSEK